MTVHWKSATCLFLLATGCSSSSVVGDDRVGMKESQVVPDSPSHAPSSASKNGETRGLSISGVCDADEAVFFQCQSNGKSISVCGKRMANGESALRFVLGGKKNISTAELDHPDLSWSMQGYSGGGEIQIRMEEDGREIVAYSRVVRTQFEAGAQHDPQDEAGIIEHSQGRVIFHQACENPSDAVRYKADPAEYMRRGDFRPLNLP